MVRPIFLLTLKKISWKIWPTIWNLAIADPSFLETKERAASCEMGEKWIKFMFSVGSRGGIISFTVWIGWAGESMLEIRISLFGIVVRLFKRSGNQIFCISIYDNWQESWFRKRLNLEFSFALVLLLPEDVLQMLSSANNHFLQWSSTLAKTLSYLSTMTHKFPWVHQCW